MTRLLDLFCGAGGAAMGYSRAGFDEIVGVDIKPMPRYPFEFVQGDALEYLAEHGHEFDAIHASPPCQLFSIATLGHTKEPYQDLLTPTRTLLCTGATPWIIENTPGAPMEAHIRLCGCMVGLPSIRRVRWFETSWCAFNLMPTCYHPCEVITVVGHGTPSWVFKKLGRNPPIEEKREAMGIDWMNRDELSQAIPPAYTEYIGRELLRQI
jgi:DNA (cytosine-5)-methyltransferase 1